MRRDGHEGDGRSQGRDEAVMFGPDDDDGPKIPTQVETLVRGTATVEAPEYKPLPDLDYLQVPFAYYFHFTGNLNFLPISHSVCVCLTEDLKTHIQ
jgi:hypothetical protein